MIRCSFFMLISSKFIDEPSKANIFNPTDLDCYYTSQNHKDFSVNSTKYKVEVPLVIPVGNWLCDFWARQVPIYNSASYNQFKIYYLVEGSALLYQHCLNSSSQVLKHSKPFTIGIFSHWYVEYVGIAGMPKLITCHAVLKFFLCRTSCSTFTKAQ